MFTTYKNHPIYPKNETRQNKDARALTTRYLNWLQETKRHWWQPDLEAYRDMLLEDETLSSSTVAMYVSGVKRQYREFLESDAMNMVLAKIQKSENLPEDWVEKTIAHMQTQTHPKTASVDYKRVDNISHLTQAEIEELIGQVEIRTLKDLRDLLVISLILFTGISEIELCELKPSHIKLDENGIHIHVPMVSGGKERVVQVREDLFYEPAWWQRAFQNWLVDTKIEEGTAFRGFYRGGNSIRKNKMQPTAVQALLRAYAVKDDAGEDKNFTALDLRRTYARRLFDNGAEIDDIQKNLGHDSHVTTKTYIGLPDRDDNLGSELRGNGYEILATIN